MIMIQTMNVAGLTCDACTKLTSKRLEKIDGVESATVDLGTGVATIYANRTIDTNEADAAFDGTHYRVEKSDEKDN